MVEDARSRTKIYLDAYLRNSELTYDDTTEVNFTVCYEDADYPLVRVFKSRNIDLLFLIGIPNSTPMIDFDGTPFGYEEHVPITVCCIDKSGITGTKLLWKGVAELRYVAETYPTGSHRNLDEMRPETVKLGSTIMHQQRCILNYRRDTT